MYEVRELEDTEREQAILDNLFQGVDRYHNTPPVNMREITEEEYANSIVFSYRPDAGIFQQIIDGTNDRHILWKGDPITHAISITFHVFFDGNAYGIYSERYKVDDPDVSPWDRYRNRLRYFKAGCDHEYQQLSVEEAKARGIEHLKTRRRIRGIH